MITLDFITALFYETDEQMDAIPKHPEAHLWPSEVVTLGLLHALKLTFRPLFCPSKAICEEPPVEGGAGATYRLFHAL